MVEPLNLVIAGRHRCSSGLCDYSESLSFTVTGVRWVVVLPTCHPSGYVWFGGVRPFVDELENRTSVRLIHDKHILGNILRRYMEFSEGWKDFWDAIEAKGTAYRSSYTCYYDLRLVLAEAHARATRCEWCREVFDGYSMRAEQWECVTAWSNGTRRMVPRYCSRTCRLRKQSKVSRDEHKRQKEYQWLQKARKEMTSVRRFLKENKLHEV